MSAVGVMNEVGHWSACVFGNPIDVWIDRRADPRDGYFRVSYRRPGRDHIHFRAGLTEAEAFAAAAAAAAAASLRTDLAATWVPAPSPNGKHG